MNDHIARIAPLADLDGAELSDADLEQVVGGLARVWQADSAPRLVVDAIPAHLAISPIAPLDALQRIA